MDLTFRSIGPWGPGKGANLDAPEVDANFWSLAEAIVALQNDPPLPVGIASISVSGTQMTITLTDGTVMGPFTLPVLTFRWRGEWLPLTPYAVLDVFSVLDLGIYMVQIAHTSAATFDPDPLIADGTILQLFGSTNAKLSGLSDVTLTDLADLDFLQWMESDAKWENVHLGTMAYQEDNNVLITGGQIHGMPSPSLPGDVATKAYVDALPAGMMIADARLMANIAGMSGPALPNTLSDFLDYVLATTTRGTLLFRGGTGWLALPPGTAGQFLQTAGSGADPAWHAGGSGVTSITAGAGIDTSPDDIVDTGTIALAAIADKDFLANISGTAAAPTPTTLTLFLDHVLTNARGTILTRTVGGWVALSPGSTGQYLKTQGAAADLMWDSPAGSGTVTSVDAGTGITTGGAPITGSGTVSLAAIANLSLLANTSGGSAAPVPTTATLLLDRAFGTTQGAVLYRNASAWVMLTPGTAGQILTTGGAAANPAWANAPAGAPIAAQRVLSNITGGTAVAVGNTLSDIIDSMLGSSRGMLLYRGASGWAALAAGTSGQLLQTGGPTGNPTWITSPASSLTLPIGVPDGGTGAVDLPAPPGAAGAYLLGNGTGPITASAWWYADAVEPYSIIGRTSVADGWCPYVEMASAGGTLAAPAATPAGTPLGGYYFEGHDGTDWTTGAANLTFYAAADFSPGSLQTYADLWTSGGDFIFGPTGDLTVPGTAILGAPLPVTSGGTGVTSGPKYVVATYVPGTMTANQNLLYHRVTKAITIPANLGPYLGHATQAGGSANATLVTAIVLQQALAAAPTVFTTVATITIPPGTLTGLLSTQAAISFAQGDVLRVRGPATADATFADFHMSLVGMET